MKPAHWLASIAIIAAAVIAVAAISWFGETPPVGNPSSPSHEGDQKSPSSRTDKAPLAVPPGLDQIVRELESDITHDQAVTDLKSIPYSQIEQLRRALRETGNSRTKSVIEKRINALQEQIAANPPLISVDFKETSLEQMIAVLNEKMTTDIRYQAHPIVQPHLFTLQKSSASYWDVIYALNDQFPIMFLPTFRPHMTLAEDIRGMQGHDTAGPFTVFAYASDNRPVPGGRAPPTPQPLRWTLRYSLGIDPRLWALETSMRATVSADDAGNVLVPVGDPFTPNPPILYPSNCYLVTAPLNIPSRPGKTISSIKVEGKILVAATDHQAAIHFTEPGDRGFQLDDVRFSVKCFVRSEIPRTDFNITAASATGKPLYIKYRLVDRPDIDILQTRTSPGTGSFQFPTATPPPFILETRIPAKIEERAVSFEIRNLPLPTAPQ